MIVASLGGVFYTGCGSDEDPFAESPIGGSSAQNEGGLGPGGVAESSSSAGGPDEGGTSGVGGDSGRGDAGTGDEAGSAGDAGTGGDPSSGGVAGEGGQPDRPPLWGEACSGYTLIGSPENDAGSAFDALLVDMEGNVVHTWGITGFPPKMLSTGGLLGCSGVQPGTYDCTELLQLNWEGDLEWSFAGWESIGGVLGARHHHDYFRGRVNLGYYAPGIDLSGQGSTFVLAHTDRELPEIRAGVVQDDVIYDVTEQGTLGDFLWYGGDHFDDFGLDQAARDDLAGRAGDRYEILHGNSITPLGPNRWYDAGHAEFHPDNILYSSRNANIVVIIDRKTGEVVWRIGPDVAGRPEEALGQFMGQHHPHLIPKGLPGAGHMLLYDNGGPAGYGGRSVGTYRYSRAYSRVIEFDPLTFERVWEYGAASGDEFFSSQLLSNAQRLPNGNTLITIGTSGRVIEVTPDKKVVWQYQFTPEDPSGKHGWIYRAYRVPPEWVPDAVNAEGRNYASWKSLFE